MTLVLGFHLGRYAMLVADTRVSWFPPDAPIAYRDERVKISRTSLGLITGAGFIGLLDAVKRRLDFQDLFLSDRIVEIAAEERQRIETDPRYRQDPRVIESLSTTGWLFTYVNPSKDNGIRLRLAVCHPANGYKLALVQENASFVMMPVGANEDQVDSTSRMIQESVKPLTEILDLQENIQYHASVAGAIIRDVAKGFESVSPSFHVGVQAIDGYSGISPFVHGEGTWHFTLEPPPGSA